MLEQEILLSSQRGLHLRPAGRLCELAMRYRCRSQMVIGDKSFNLKSVLSVLSAQVAAEREILLQCDGADEREAMEALSKFLTEDMDRGESGD